MSIDGCLSRSERIKDFRSISFIRLKTCEFVQIKCIDDATVDEKILTNRFNTFSESRYFKFQYKVSENKLIAGK